MPPYRRTTGALVALVLAAALTFSGVPAGGQAPENNQDDQQAQAGQTAKLLGELAKAGSPNLAGGAAAFAKQASLYQAKNLGLDHPAEAAPIKHKDLSQSALELLQRYGVEPLDQDKSAVQELDNLPEPSKSTLSRYIQAFLSFERATKQAFDGVDPEKVKQAQGNESDANQTQRPGEVMDQMGVGNLQEVFASRLQLIEATEQLGEALDADASERTAAGSSQSLAAQPAIDLSPALFIDPNGENNTYNKNYALVIDAGGDDTYLNNAGGSYLGPARCLTGPPNSAAAALFDNAGNDKYQSAGNCGVNGGAYGGAGFLFDRQGNDEYTGGEAGTNGGARLGLGFLLDGVGNDEYVAGSFATNGGGDFGGSGMLVDLGGSDSYQDPAVPSGKCFDCSVVPKKATGVPGAASAGAQLDSDSRAQVKISDASATEPDYGAAAAEFQITMDRVQTGTVSVQFSTTDGSAVASTDYEPVTGVVTFAPGETTKTIAIALKADLLAEEDEYFFVNLSNPNNATIGDGQGKATILNDNCDNSDRAPFLAINDTAVKEGDSGTTEAVFTVCLSRPSSKQVTVDYVTNDSTATQPDDYQQAEGRLTFPPGVTQQVVPVKIRGDTQVEKDEVFYAVLSNPSQAPIERARASGAIKDDELGLSIEDVIVSEGNGNSQTDAQFTVSLRPPSTQQVTVNYSTKDGTATAPGDYESAAGKLTFAPGETTKKIAIALKADLLAEENENFFVDLSNPNNATIGDGQGKATILNDNCDNSDRAPFLAINDTAVKEGDTGTTDAVFTVCLSRPSSKQVTVDYVTNDSTATQPDDYQQAEGRLTFPPGVTQQVVPVKIRGDTQGEDDEVFYAVLSNPSQAPIERARASGTIKDDELGLLIDDVIVSEGNGNSQTDAQFTVSLRPPSTQQVTVNYSTKDDTATAPGDYESAAGKLTFAPPREPVTGAVTLAPGETTKKVTVRIKRDDVLEPDESFFVDLSEPTNAPIADGRGIGTIFDDDGRYAENSGVPGGVFLTGHDADFHAQIDNRQGAKNIIKSSIAYVSRKLSSPRILLVTGVPSTNSCPQKYVDPREAMRDSGFSSFDVANYDGKPHGTAATNLLDLRTVPFDKDVYDVIVVSSDCGGWLGQDELDILVDRRSDLVRYVNSGGGLVALTEGQELARPFGFLPCINTGTPAAQKDTGNRVTPYGKAMGLTDSDVNGSFTHNIFAEPSGFVPVDHDSSGRILTLASRSGLTAGGCAKRRSSLTVGDVAITEGDSGTRMAALPVTLDASNADLVRVAYKTQERSATADEDFITSEGIVEFSPGQTANTIKVPVRGDTKVEPDEDLLVVLSGAENAFLAKASGSLTIINDDSAPEPDGSGPPPAALITGVEQQAPFQDDQPIPNPLQESPSRQAVQQSVPLPQPQSQAQGINQQVPQASVSQQAQQGSEQQAQQGVQQVAVEQMQAIQQQQAQSALQPGLAVQPEKGRQIETAHIGGSAKQQSHLASDLSRPAPGPAVIPLLVTLMGIFGMTKKLGNTSSRGIPVPARSSRRRRASGRTSAGRSRSARRRL